MRHIIYKTLLLFFVYCLSYGQNGQISGIVQDNLGIAIPFANITLQGIQTGAITDTNGLFEINNIPFGSYTITTSFTGYETSRQKVLITESEPHKKLKIKLKKGNILDEIVISGTLKPVKRSESPVPVEIYSPTFFKKNPTSNLFEALQNVNGIRPQLNCSICNTGDIHINGLEGPYTLVMIDGMPIISGLSTVYGLSGIPNSLIERVEVVKGPASSLYGSEAVGGIINVITKNPSNAPEITSDLMVTGWGETNLDFGFKTSIGKSTSLVGVNYFLYDQIIDNNNDGFTDIPLQNRISVFNKWNFERSSGKNFSLAGRYFYEDRWGGQEDWTSDDRGGNEIYGESIYTSRLEFLGNYELPTTESINISFSFNNHDQNSFYGDVSYQAEQRIGFIQSVWDKQIKSHNLLIGGAFRYQYYNDNTPATESAPDETYLPGIFVQDEIALNKKHKLLLGTRLDYDNRHGSIFTPRIAYKWTVNSNNIFRINAGTGFRVVNLFTEDHAALTGSRDVVIEEDLNPEESYNINLNYLKKVFFKNGTFITLDASSWYTHFTNAILPDYDTNPQQIRYGNLDGHAVSQGVSLNTGINFYNGLKVMTGLTVMDVSRIEDGERTRQTLTENVTGTWGISYKIQPWNLSIDYTGNLYGPMKLATFGDDDPRRDESPWWSIQNIQFTYKSKSKVEFYGGVKNLLDWTPNRGNPFLISRANDPFEQTIDTSDDQTPFDTTYIYGPNQGIRGFVGVRYNLM